MLKLFLRSSVSLCLIKFFNTISLDHKRKTFIFLMNEYYRIQRDVALDFIEDLFSGITLKKFKYDENLTIVLVPYGLHKTFSNTLCGTCRLLM